MLASTTRKICPSTFRKYRPQFIKLQGRIPFRQSCCEVFQNFEFIINSASRFVKDIPGSIDGSIDSSMCTYTTYFPHKKCAVRACSDCGVDKLKLRLKQLNNDLLGDKRKRYLVKQLETRREKIPGTGKYKSYMHW